MIKILVACNNRNKEWCPFGSIDCECDAYIPRELEESEFIDFTCTDKYDNERDCIFEEVREDSMTNKVFVPIVKTVQKILPQYLIKDLQENERICQVCHGLGMRIENNVYGIKGDTSEAGQREHFPYKHQALTFCQSCFNGVQKLCPYCGKPYERGDYYCDCAGQNKADEERRMKKLEERVAKAKEVQESDVKTYLYCEEFDSYYSEVDDFFDSYACNYNDEKSRKRPERLWVCSAAEIALDADSIVENACEELHEDAYENCDTNSLQKLLNSWCEKQSGTTTYYPCYKEYVTIDWSRYDG